MQEDFVFDEIPQPKPRQRSTSSIPVVLALAIAILAATWWSGRTPAPRRSSLQAKDLSIHGIRLGTAYADLVKQRGKPQVDQTGPDGTRVVSFVPGGMSELYVLSHDQVIDMEVRGSGSVQFPAGEAKVGDSRESLEKLLGIAAPANSPGLSQTVWLCQDCRFAAQLPDGKVTTLKVFTQPER